MTSSTAWPTNVIARYLTVGGATVDITDVRAHGRYYTPERTVHAKCSGAGCTSSFAETGRGWDEAEPYDVAAFDAALLSLREQAQAHAETCRALPKPTN